MTIEDGPLRSSRLALCGRYGFGDSCFGHIARVVQVYARKADAPPTRRTNRRQSASVTPTSAGFVYPRLEQRAVKRPGPGDDDGSFVKAGYAAAVVNIGSWPCGDPNYHGGFTVRVIRSPVIRLMAQYCGSPPLTLVVVARVGRQHLRQNAPSITSCAKWRKSLKACRIWNYVCRLRQPRTEFSVATGC